MTRCVYLWFVDDRSFTVDVGPFKRNQISHPNIERSERSDSAGAYPYSYYSNAYDSNRAATNNAPTYYGSDQVAAAYEAPNQEQTKDMNVAFGDASTAAQQSTVSSSSEAAATYNAPSYYGGQQVAAAYSDQNQGQSEDIKVSLGDASTAAEQSTGSSSPGEASMTYGAPSYYGSEQVAAAYSDPRQSENTAAYSEQNPTQSENIKVTLGDHASTTAAQQSSGNASLGVRTSDINANNGSAYGTQAPSAALPQPAQAPYQPAVAAPPSTTNSYSQSASNESSASAYRTGSPYGGGDNSRVIDDSSAGNQGANQSSAAAANTAPAPAAVTPYGADSARGYDPYNQSSSQAQTASTNRITYSESPLNASSASSATSAASEASDHVQRAQNESAAGSYPVPAPAPAPAQSQAPYPAPSPGPSPAYAPYPAPSQAYGPYTAPSPAPYPSPAAPASYPVPGPAAAGAPAAKETKPLSKSWSV